VPTPRKSKQPERRNVRPPGKQPSGRMLLRLPVELHTELLAEAERQGTTGNTLVVALLASGLRWRDDSPDARDARGLVPIGPAHKPAPRARKADR
jgi:hypothetical protein